ncbi:transposase [Mycobacterium botniense]|uniref:Transposase n=1 Tax=Mycobacterium botniense TaxID=84962 RepID=A0A7I9Y0M8_9MYCO|nr:transposase [Mycobacterium botniense]GFG75503.1 hypothetical protein MBOT_28680 [Mycobacterium botniense]
MSQWTWCPGRNPAAGSSCTHWVVERTNSWINHCRRIDRHYQTTLAARKGFRHLSQIALLLRRLDRSQLFDTL